MKYRIVYAENTSLLAEQVNEWLKNGWKLYGDPFVSNIKSHEIRGEKIEMEYVYQAMTK